MEERKPEIPLFGEHLWLKEEVEYDPESNILRGYDGCYYIEVDFNIGFVKGRRLGRIEVFEDGTIQFRDGENYKDAVEDVETAKQRYCPGFDCAIDWEVEDELWRDWENASTLEELAEVIKKHGDKEDGIYFLEAFEADSVSFRELDKGTLTELYRLVGKDVLEKDAGQKQDVKSRKKKYNRGMSL